MTTEQESIENTFNSSKLRSKIERSCLKLACLYSVLQNTGEVIDDDSRNGAKIILNDVIDELKALCG